MIGIEFKQALNARLKVMHRCHLVRRYRVVLIAIRQADNLNIAGCEFDNVPDLQPTNDLWLIEDYHAAPPFAAPRISQSLTVLRATPRPAAISAFDMPR